MKRLAFLPFLVGVLSSCDYQPAPSYGPGYNPLDAQGPANAVDDGKIAHNQGFKLGVRDAQRGLEPKYFRYANLYTESTQKDFGRGYMTGYRTVQPR